MRDHFDMGVIRGNKCIRCSIFEANLNADGSD